ncbi:cytochrome c oxidase subunit 3 [Mycobacterium sp. PDNC021]|uniref:cytochrome c oxidase subunit 3 n=1 Tax=Mycobacterium sp. PDNC021 TaxID=3391399 RepID=UPI003AABECFB
MLRTKGVECEEIAVSALLTVGRSTTDRPTDRPTGRPMGVPGEPGIWVVIFGDLLVFSVLFVGFLIDRSQAVHAFDVARRTLHSGVGLTNTLVLLSSSLLVVIGLHALRCGRRPVATTMLGGAMALGAVFIFLKVGEYVSAISAGHTPAAGHFFTWYFLLTGMHLAHVLVGLIMLGVMTTLSRRPPPNETTMAVITAGACFWHLVDLLWIFLFPMLYLVVER